MSLPDPETWPHQTFRTILSYNPPHLETTEWEKMVLENGGHFWKAKDVIRAVPSDGKAGE